MQLVVVVLWFFSNTTKGRRENTRTHTHTHTHTHTPSCLAVLCFVTQSRACSLHVSLSRRIVSSQARQISLFNSTPRNVITYITHTHTHTQNPHRLRYSLLLAAAKHRFVGWKEEEHTRWMVPGSLLIYLSKQAIGYLSATPRRLKATKGLL